MISSCGEHKGREEKAHHDEGDLVDGILEELIDHVQEVETAVAKVGLLRNLVERVSQRSAASNARMARTLAAFATQFAAVTVTSIFFLSRASLTR